jgi:hypothetical protein
MQRHSSARTGTVACGARLALVAGGVVRLRRAGVSHGDRGVNVGSVDTRVCAIGSCREA